MRLRFRPLALALLAAAAGALAVPAGADEIPWQSLSLPAEPGPHWLWVGDELLHRSALFDADTGALLGMVPGGRGIIAPSRSRDGRELYLPSTYYSRGTRGARTDVVTILDASSLRTLGEVVIPPKRSEHTSWAAGSALSDDGRFLAVFNQTPASSLSIVDVAERRLAGEIETPGCGLVYAAGPRRFLSLCADGSALFVTLDERGGEATKSHGARFFDATADPVTEKAVRHGDTWLFVSFEGYVHPLDVSGAEPRSGERWSLLDAPQREQGWRIGGMQPFALHGPSGRLYALMHRGGVDTHKDPGTEVWIVDVAQRARVRRIGLRNPLASFVLEQIGVAPQGFAARSLGLALRVALPNPGVDRIAVTQDPEPVLLAATAFPATLAVYDARSGTHLRDVKEPAIATMMLVLP